MSYVALYRKYRPRVFSDVYGQEHITATLTNQVKLGKVSHAYLFTGSRGTGKTTCAKIFARAVNCQTPQDGSPCGNCPVCKALDDPANIDVLEIDAASNNKVDEVREIRERVKYLPVNGKYKVYIIDEVHMLTDSAFNALLKTLEEPPAHVIFILATTEVHKLPATILSRCMRFDFRLVGTGELKTQLKKVYDAEHKEHEEAAVSYIAEAAEGSVRDMLSIADMCLHYSDGKLTYADVLRVLGANDRRQIAELTDAIACGNITGIFQTIDEFAKNGKSMSLIAKDLAKYARDLLAIKAGGTAFLGACGDRIEEMKTQADGYTADFLIALIAEFSGIDAELRYSVSPRIVLETAAIRAGKLSSDSYHALSERVRRLEEDGVSVKTAVSSQSAPQESPPSEQDAPRVPVHTLESAVRAVNAEDAKSIWGRLITRFRKSSAMSLYSLLGEHTDYRLEGNALVITAADERYLRFSDAEVIQKIDEELSASGIPLKVRVEKQAAGLDMDKEIARVKRVTGLNPKVEK